MAFLNLQLMATAQAAHEEAQSSGLLQALGIDVKLLLVQAAAFLILVWLLGKFVYPVIIRAIEDRRKAIEEGLSHAKKADEELKKAQEKVTQIIQHARDEADDILAHSKKESQAMIAAAEESAVQRAEGIVQDAHVQVQSDIANARQALRDETVKLVAQATQEIIGQKLDDPKDSALIHNALKEQR